MRAFGSRRPAPPRGRRPTAPACSPTSCVQYTQHIVAAVHSLPQRLPSTSGPATRVKGAPFMALRHCGDKESAHGSLAMRARSNIASENSICTQVHYGKKGKGGRARAQPMSYRHGQRTLKDGYAISDQEMTRYKSVAPPRAPFERGFLPCVAVPSALTHKTKSELQAAASHKRATRDCQHVPPNRCR